MNRRQPCPTVAPAKLKRIFACAQDRVLLRSSLLTAVAIASVTLSAVAQPAGPSGAINSGLADGEAKRRWEQLNTIRRDKFDLILPEVMRENNVDMWITMIREANYGNWWQDFGEGYASKDGFYVFTDRGGDRIERAALGISGYRLEQSGAYDLFLGADALAEFVRERDPKTIAINTAPSIGPLDTLSHSGHEQLVNTLGPKYAERFVSAEKLGSDFLSRRVASEIAAFGHAGEMSREIAERALSNEVITPGVTMLEDVGWWIQERLFERGLDLSFGMPSIYITGPDGVEAVSNERIIQRGRRHHDRLGCGVPRAVHRHEENCLCLERRRGSSASIAAARPRRGNQSPQNHHSDDQAWAHSTASGDRGLCSTRRCWIRADRLQPAD